ncbi:MAG: response regulator transcription factor RpaB [Vampirovibrionales bacterium]
MNMNLPPIFPNLADFEEEAPESEPLAKLLIIDDEASIRRILEARFRLLGFDTATAADGEQALLVFEQFKPDILVLDIMMPKLDGFGVLRELRKHSDVPIILLTALGDVSDRITGLELGADDYVVKPFSPKELEVRVKTILRRATAMSSNKRLAPSLMKEATPKETSSYVLTLGDLKIDFPKRHVYRAGQRIRLTGMEFCLLELLATHSGKSFTRAEILQHVWSYPPDQRIDTRVVDVHVSRLREKLELDKSQPEYILTARGVGYMFQKLANTPDEDASSVEAS